MTSKYSKLKWTTSGRQVVSLQSFEHFDLISVIEYKPREIVFNLFLMIMLPVFDLHFHWSFSKMVHTRKRKSNCAIITPFSWSVLWMTIALNQSACEKLPSYFSYCMFMSLLDQESQMALFLALPLFDKKSVPIWKLSCHCGKA